MYILFFCLIPKAPDWVVARNPMGLLREIYPNTIGLQKKQEQASPGWLEAEAEEELPGKGQAAILLKEGH